MRISGENRLATYAAIAAAVVIPSNWIVYEGLQEASDGAYDNGVHVNGTYVVPDTQSEFRCIGPDKTILQRHDEIYPQDQVSGSLDLSDDVDYGLSHACDDGRLDPIDGKFWKRPLNKYGFLGKVLQINSWGS